MLQKLLLGLALLASSATYAELSPAQRQVWEAERSFAHSMARRDHAAFARHLSEEAVFFTGAQVLRGKSAVAQGWKSFYDGAQPPFSWEPDSVEVLAEGHLALSTGPVRNPQGQIVARYTSIWREEAPGVWRVVFDKGCNVCEDCANSREKKS